MSTIWKRIIVILLMAVVIEAVAIYDMQDRMNMMRERIERKLREQDAILTTLSDHQLQLDAQLLKVSASKSE